MYLKFVLLFTSICAIFQHVGGNLTFKNAMVLCEYDDPAPAEEITFVTIVTAKNLKQHLPSGQSCLRIEIEHSNLPIIFDGAFTNINGVKYLLLENNNIQEIYPGAFTNLTVSDSMSLKFNKITEIKNGVFNQVSVPALHLSSNYISKIHQQAFDHMLNLEELYLDNNKLTYLDSNWFKNTPKLHKVVLRHNYIERVPTYAFKNLVSKRYNELTIDLSYNLIKFVDGDAFKKPNRFKYLSLAKNQIHDLRDDWLIGVQVGKLDISYNKLQCLLNNGLAAPSSINIIEGNPWICSCLVDMRQKEENGLFGHIVADEAYRKCNIRI